MTMENQTNVDDVAWSQRAVHTSTNVVAYQGQLYHKTRVYGNSPNTVNSPSTFDCDDGSTLPLAQRPPIPLSPCGRPRHTCHSSKVHPNCHRGPVQGRMATVPLWPNHNLMVASILGCHNNKKKQNWLPKNLRSGWNFSSLHWGCLARPYGPHGMKLFMDRPKLYAIARRSYKCKNGHTNFTPYMPLSARCSPIMIMPKTIILSNTLIISIMTLCIFGISSVEETILTREHPTK